MLPYKGKTVTMLTLKLRKTVFQLDFSVKFVITAIFTLFIQNRAQVKQDILSQD